jgi:hypothetical protein
MVDDDKVEKGEKSPLSFLFGDNKKRGSGDFKYRVTGKKSGKSIIVSANNVELADDEYRRRVKDEPVIVEEILPDEICFTKKEIETIQTSLLGSQMDIGSSADKAANSEIKDEMRRREDELGKEKMKMGLIRRMMKKHKTNKVCVRVK